MSPSTPTTYTCHSKREQYSLRIKFWHAYFKTSLVAQRIKCLPAMQETWVQSLGWKESPGEGNGNPLQYSCLETPIDRGAWQATVHRVAKY